MLPMTIAFYLFSGSGLSREFTLSRGSTLHLERLWWHCLLHSIHLNGPSQLYKPLPWQQNVTQVPAWISDSGILLGLHPGSIGATGFLHFFLLEHSSGPRLSHSYGLMRPLKLA